MASVAQAFAALRRLLPEGAAKYLQQRGQLTQTFAWQDLWQEEHAQQFTVSRLARLDLLAGIRDQIVKSVGGDLSRRDFMRNSEAMLSKAGWWGEKTVRDEATGDDVSTTFDANRLKLIYDMNTRTAYAAGQWERFQATKKTHPYLRYITLHDERVRLAHRPWDGVTLSVDDPWWTTHLPPNGWRCRCRVVAVSKRDYERGVTPQGAAMKKVAPPVEMREWLDKRSGEIHQVPVGIDPGFGYNVGIAGSRVGTLQQSAATKLANAPADLAQAARKAGTEPWHTPSERAAAAGQFILAAVKTPKAKQPMQTLASVSSGAVSKAAAVGIDLAGKTVALEHDGVLHVLRSHGRENEQLRGQIPVTVEDLARFNELFNRARLRPGDPPVKKDGSLVVEGEAVLGGVVYHFAARVLRRHVVPLTMFKRPVK